MTIVVEADDNDDTLIGDDFVAAVSHSRTINSRPLRCFLPLLSMTLQQSRLTSI